MLIQALFFTNMQEPVQPTNKDTLFGHEIPMPRSDLLVALVTVVSFLPATIILYRLGRAIARVFKAKKA